MPMTLGVSEQMPNTTLQVQILPAPWISRMGVLIQTRDIYRVSMFIERYAPPEEPETEHMEVLCKTYWKETRMAGWW